VSTAHGNQRPQRLVTRSFCDADVDGHDVRVEVKVQDDDYNVSFITLDVTFTTLRPGVSANRAMPTGLHTCRPHPKTANYQYFSPVPASTGWATVTEGSDSSDENGEVSHGWLAAAVSPLPLGPEYGLLDYGELPVVRVLCTLPTLFRASDALLSCSRFHRVRVVAAPMMATATAPATAPRNATATSQPNPC
jgi:hypothetical protein